MLVWHAWRGGGVLLGLYCTSYKIWYWSSIWKYKGLSTKQNVTYISRQPTLGGTSRQVNHYFEDKLWRHPMSQLAKYLLFLLSSMRVSVAMGWGEEPHAQSCASGPLEESSGKKRRDKCQVLRLHEVEARVAVFWKIGKWSVIENLKSADKLVNMRLNILGREVLMNISICRFCSKVHAVHYWCLSSTFWVLKDFWVYPTTQRQ